MCVDEKHRRTYAWYPLVADGSLEAGVEVVHPGIVHEVNTQCSFQFDINGGTVYVFVLAYVKRESSLTSYIKYFVKICNNSQK